MTGMSSKTSSKKPRPSKTNAWWLQWCIKHGNCAMIHSSSGVRPTRSPYRQNTPCAQWLPSTCTLNEYDSCVTFHKLYAQPFHTLNIPTPKSEYHSGIVAKRESVSRCSSEFKMKGFLKRIKTLEKNTDCHDPKVLFCLYMILVLFCFQNSSLIIR